MATGECSFAEEGIVEAGRPCSFEFRIIGESEIEAIAERLGDGPDGQGEVEAVHPITAGYTVMLSGGIAVIDVFEIE